jgi:hypothetical protein
LNLIIHLSKSTSRFENPRQKPDRLSHTTPSNTGEFVPAGANLLRLDDEPSGTVKAPFVYRVTDSSSATLVLKGTDGSERGDKADLLGQPAFL